MTYYNEVKEDILEAMEENYIKEELKNYTSAEAAYDRIYELIDNKVTGNIDGSYYCSSYKARQKTYNFSNEVIAALEEYGYTNELKKFKTFIFLVEDGYLNIENMEILDKTSDFYDVIQSLFEEEVEDLNFEVLDVITRSYYLSSLLWEVLENKF